MKLTWGQDTVTSQYPPLGVSTNRQRVSTSQQHAAYVCRSCAIVLLLLSSDEPLSPNDTMRKRSHCYFHISEPHLPATHTCPLFLIAHEKLQAAPKGFVRWTFSLPGIWHWATASSGMYGYRWLFAIVSNKMKMIKLQTWCKMKNSIWTIVPNILIYCMHFCTFNLRYIWNKVNLRPLHCFF